MILPVNAGLLPPGVCPSDYQSLLNLFSSVQTVTVPDSNITVIASSTKPADVYQGHAAWLKLDGDGIPERVYWYVSGFWTARHPLEPGITALYTTAFPDTIYSFDGGDGTQNDPTPNTGAMWEIVAELTGRVPLGIAIGAVTQLNPSNRVVALGDTLGEDKHTLLVAEMPAHGHNINGYPLLSKNGNTEANTQFQTGAEKAWQTPILDGADEPHENMPPALGVYFIRRTKRIVYLV